MTINFASTRIVSLSAILFAASLTLSGCGGGGNGPTVSPTATPTPDVANFTYDKTKYVPNYVSDLEEAKKSTPQDPVALLRWTRFPLSVYFARNANYTAAKQALASEGFNRWVNVTGSNGVTYTVANSATNADITVEFGTFTGGAGDILGQTFYTYDPESRVLDKGARIVINFTGDRSNDLITSSHEFGHALGINEHSRNPLDLMYFTGNDTFSGNITQSDLNTVLTSYDARFNKDANARVAPSSGNKVSTSIQ